MCIFFPSAAWHTLLPFQNFSVWLSAEKCIVILFGGARLKTGKGMGRGPSALSTKRLLEWVTPSWFESQVLSCLDNRTNSGSPHCVVSLGKVMQVAPAV